MAAILPFLETEEFHFPTDLGDGGLSGLGGGKKKLTDEEFLAQSNVELTNLLWTRSLVADALKGKTFQLAADDRKLVIRLSSPVDAYVVPWGGMPSDSQNISFFSDNGKMRCPTFDLPAGGMTVGGTCPAAGPAQVTSAARGEQGKKSLLTVIDGQEVMKHDTSVVFNRAKAVCASCYASGGSFGRTTVQVSELVHYAVMRAAVEKGNGAMREALIRAILWQIPILPYDFLQVQKGAGKDDPKKGTTFTPPEKIRQRMSAPRPNLPYGYPKTIRVHSSGDFFSIPYAELWIEVARRLYAQHGMDFILWAPTRTQFKGDFKDFWATAKLPPNFVIRPSGYHVGDPAPMTPGLAAGTSVLDEDESKIGRGEKFDHQCGVYDLAEGDKTCVEAVDPDGNIGCRACWVRPDLRVNYVAH